MAKYLIPFLFLLPLISFAQADTSQCYCVVLARSYSPAVPVLNADQWQYLPQEIHSVPSVGGQMLMRYWSSKKQKWIWDINTITGFTDKGFEVIGVSFDDCSPTRRVIEYNDPRIQSFYNF